ncbi:hypothetical protein [Dethiosulfatarculus sandiegensis]|uniref:Uncharacterized protein n=1 Tax=Dethiosulfatarculus sandiegensis TaxID=1429043 RepID=A0A0D2JD77_9BACT|nr:hypothetical protein [Dethiosulfatarculus sandiegensis]KIX13696.1 hypothetical protein X474_12025 [Dethiosulfatarculus sandiegensis]
MSNGGGAATNTGIDYQQRLAAYFLIQMLLEMDSLIGIGLDGVHSINTVSFESSSCIDDITLTTDIGNLYFQAKRNISISGNVNSEFYKTTSQFVNQFLSDPTSNDKYILATSSTASSKVRYDLRKILESVRLNDTNFKENPLNKSEKEVYAKLKNNLSTAYQNSTNEVIAETILVSLLKRIYVVIADVQQGTPLEGAILTVLSARSKVKPELLFSITISLALSLASQRQSINKRGIESKLARYLDPISLENKLTVEKDMLNVEFDGSNIPSDQDVLLVDSILNEADYMIITLFRFDDAGNKRAQFYGDTCKTPNGIEWKVIHRAATYAGIHRFIEEKPDLFTDKKVVILEPAADTELSSSFSLAYQELCKSVLERNTQILQCLHCGDFISESSSPLIEIDQTDADHSLGLVHKSCLKPIDRVIGLIKSDFFEDHNFLKHFDYKSWIDLAPKGQALFASLQGKIKQVMFMAWNPEGASEFKGNHCLKINLKDGSSRYVHHRGQIVRKTMSSASDMASFFNSQFEQARLNGDPTCYSSAKEVFGPYSICMQMKDESEECIECINAEVVKYTLAIENAYNRFSNYYAPVVALFSKESGQPVIVKNTLFIIDNPLKLKVFLDNWSKAGIVLPEYKIEIIKSDDEFDKILSKLLKSGIQVVANPLFDMKQNPLSGIVFRHIDELETIH